MASPQAGFALVTPASRGLGFAFARQLLTRTEIPVVATARQNCDTVRSHLLDGVSASKNAEKRLQVFQVDVTDESTISAMTAQLRDLYPSTKLRLALTIPGILSIAEKAPSQIDGDKTLESLRVNCIGPMLLAKHLSPLLPNKSTPQFPATVADSDQNPLRLPPHAVYGMMAARLGSISDNQLGGWYSYRVGKSGVFQMAKSLDLYLRNWSRDRAMAVAMHPGTVKTDFTREYQDGRGMLSAEEAADRLLRVLCGMSAGVDGGRGRCWDWQGKEVPP